MKNTFLFIAFLMCALTYYSCDVKDVSDNQSPEVFLSDTEKLKSVIRERGKSWSNGLKQQDENVFRNLYDKDAHYLPDGDAALHGNEAIAAFWKASFPFLKDIQLTMESLEGTESLLYETGKGIALIASQSGGTDTLHYKYVNVWKKQSDGTYKVVIDTYNDVSPNK